MLRYSLLLLMHISSKTIFCQFAILPFLASFKKAGAFIPRLYVYLFLFSQSHPIAVLPPAILSRSSALSFLPFWLVISSAAFSGVTDPDATPLRSVSSAALAMSVLVYVVKSLSSIINLCDIVLTIPNVTAHLAGALGIKTFLILESQNLPTWYWNFENNTSFWYNSIRKFQKPFFLSEINKKMTQR